LPLHGILKDPSYLFLDARVHHSLKRTQQLPAAKAEYAQPQFEVAKEGRGILAIEVTIMVDPVEKGPLYLFLPATVVVLDAGPCCSLA
jgi:hypothetical protein